MILSLALLITAPLTLFFVRKRIKYILNIFFVLFGIKTWVGYCTSPGKTEDSLPSLKPGILSPVPVLENRNINGETIDRINLLYAKDYKIMNDISFILRDFRHLGK